MEQQLVQPEQIKTGDVFQTSWGYDQTNYDYIIIVELSKTGKTAICQLARCDRVGYSSQCNIQKPVAKGYGYKFRMQIKPSYRGNFPCLVGSYPFCASEVECPRWEGQKPSLRLDRFSKVNEGEVFYETDSQFGH